MRALAVLSLFFLLTSGTVLAGEGQIEIGPTSVFPIVISQPGSYLLTTDLSTGSAIDAIWIDADNVTLDLGGHVILGGGTGGPGNGVVNKNGHGGITVRHGSLSSFYTCVSLSGSDSMNKVENVNVTTCRVGIEATRAMVANSSASKCVNTGISVSWGSVVDSQVLNSSGIGEGFALLHSSCTTCSAFANAYVGFSMAGASCVGCYSAANLTCGYSIGMGYNLLSSSLSANDNASLCGSCSGTGNACFNSNLP